MHRPRPGEPRRRRRGGGGIENCPLSAERHAELLAELSHRADAVTAGIREQVARENELADRVSELATRLSKLVGANSAHDARLERMLAEDTERSEVVKRRHEELAADFQNFRDWWSVEPSSWLVRTLAKVGFYCSLVISFLFVVPFTALYSKTKRLVRARRRRAMRQASSGASAGTNPAQAQLIAEKLLLDAPLKWHDLDSFSPVTLGTQSGIAESQYVGESAHRESSVETPVFVEPKPPQSPENPVADTGDSKKDIDDEVLNTSHSSESRRRRRREGGKDSEGDLDDDRGSKDRRPDWTIHPSNDEFLGADLKSGDFWGRFPSTTNRLSSMDR